MIDPNLLPTEPRRFRLDGATLFLGGALLLANVGLLLHSAGLSRRIADERAALDRSDAEISRLEASLPRLDDLKAEVTRLEERVRTVERLRTDARFHAELLAEVARLLPRETWLSSLALEPATGRVVLNGTSAGTPPLATVGDLMARLEGSPRLGATILTSVSRTGETYGFALEAQVSKEDPR